MAPPQKSSKRNPTKILSKVTKKPFKSRPKDKGRKPLDEAVSSNHQSSSFSLQLEDDVPDFPRGGGSALSKREIEEVRAEADEEFQNETRFLKKNKKPKGKKKNDSAEDELGSLFGDSLTGNLPKYANKITFKNISPGMKLWGVIVEVSVKDIVVSLPGGLRGLVLATEALDPLPENEKLKDVEKKPLSRIFHVGQLVSCVVLHLDDDKKEKGKRRIWLSLRLSLLHKSLTIDSIQEGMVLTACVKSIEDHGYMLYFGSSSFMGFSPKSRQSSGIDVEVNVGQLIQGVVKSIDKSRKLLHLSSDPNVVSNYVTKDLKGLSIDLLVPGMMVDARVRSTLENGILLSFLTYFTGTVDIFNLHETFPSFKWKDNYPQNKKINARILFIDPSSRAFGLTLNPHLVRNKPPPALVTTGDIFDQSRVIRVDRGLGLLVQIPSSPMPTPAYVSAVDVDDKEVKKLEKNFKEGSLVRARVLGLRLLEGLATAVLKISAFEGSVFTHSDVKPGMIVKAKVASVDSFGAIVQFGGGVKALCPLRHMSEFEINKPRKKFQIGVELVFRVLGCKSKRITVTHKKTLVKSKLKVLSSYDDAVEGLITHGWIARIDNHGCLVRFYNGVQGFAPRSELGLDPGSDVTSMYHVEQVVKCRVTSYSRSSRRMNLSFTTTPRRVLEDNMVHLGSIVSGVVQEVKTNAVVVTINGKSDLKGSISPEHLADHQGHAFSLMGVLKPGHKFDQLLVLDVEGNSLILSAKYSLVNSAEQLPSDITQVLPHSVVYGYISNIIDTGCFIRFVGRLTGFAPKSKTLDDRRFNLSEVFYIGQSVRTNVVDVNGVTSRITLSLRQSLCSSIDASFIQDYFLLDEKIARLKMRDSEASDLNWVDKFVLGSVIEGKVTERKDFGVSISFPECEGIKGFISHYHLDGITLDSGSTVHAAVLDLSKKDGLLELSLRPEFLNRPKGEFSGLQGPKKKRRREATKELEINDTVNARVEFVTDNYLVLSVPAHDFALGYASIADYNTQKLPRKKFVNGQSVTATVAALPAKSTDGRLLLLLKSSSDVIEEPSSKRFKKKCSYQVGSLVEAEITEIKPLELRVKFGSGFGGRIHITEATDDNLAEDCFKSFRVGQTLNAKILSKCHNKRSYQWELSLKPLLLSGSTEIEDGPLGKDFSYSTGERVSGFVYKVDKDWVWLSVSRDVKAQLFILDSSCEPLDLEDFQKRFYLGKALSGYILRADKEKKLLRIVLHPLIGDHDSWSNEISTCHFKEGDFVGGRISKILPGVGGVLVQIDHFLYGKVHFTELTNPLVSNPLSNYREGEFVKCVVLEVSHSAQGTVHVDLSLWPTLSSLKDRELTEVTSNGSCRRSNNQRLEKIEDLLADMVVQGYVKNISSRGCFITISRKIDAKVLLSNLSDGYVEKPEEEFPIGKLVTGKVLSVEPLSKRVEVTLKTSNAVDVQKSDLNVFNSFAVGDVISGRIKRIEIYGLFVIIDHTNVVGLCHVSELSDQRVDNIEKKYKTGERVRATVLKVDKDRRRISLGMKESYFHSNVDDQDASGLEEMAQHTLVQSHTFGGSDSPSATTNNVALVLENGKDSILAELEARASVPALEVPLDEAELSDMDQTVIQASKNDDIVDVDDHSKKRASKRLKKEREQEIRAAEERLLEKDIPRNPDEFEKLIRSSPNSSFVWIKYMEYMLNLAEVEKARSIAERALKSINFREESEKLNIWVAYFNLENKYGNPPEDVVSKLFQRALQQCEPKKLHLLLLGMYERTEQHNMADELLDRMVKKFKRSCKVWLRRVQRVLRQSEDGSQAVMNRALLCLPKHKHIKFISQTALLEFKCGVPDRGRSLFEGILREYPKRTDLWSIYLDQEIRLGDVDSIRALFERSISLSLPPKKIKFLFKKYLEFEKTQGDEEKIESVKRKALEYVESSLA